MPKKRSVTLTVFTAVVTLSAIAITTMALRSHETTERQQANPSAQLSPPPPPHTQPYSEALEEEIDSQLIQLALGEESLAKEGIVSFSTKSHYDNFLASLASKGLTLLNSSDTLLSVRIGFNDFTQLEGIEGAQITPNYQVSIPAPPEVSAQSGAVGFGGSALNSIGINSDNSHWGEGVTVAVIDSGVNDHISLKDGVTRIALTKLSEGSTQLSHGTAVASIISGNHSSTPGVAPASEILSIRVTNESGHSDSYTLAEGIIAAVDGGAQIINISMSSPHDSAVLAKAVSYAQNQGVVLVASSGNEGADSLSYPAAYAGVISVGAIEGNGEHLDFSNQGENLSLTAPGFEVNAAWDENLLAGFSGTSASAPFVSGAIAALLSENPDFTAQQAIELLLESANEGGPPGTDPQYGGGTLDVGRAFESGTPNVYDIAVTSQLIQTDANGTKSLLVVIQNQGTETLFNSPVSIQTPLGITQVSINSLTPGSTFTKSIPFNSAQFDDTFSTLTSAGLSTAEDIDPRNNTNQTNFTNLPQ